ncbi:DUF1869 domain-containing protein [Providencia sp. Je.9.19]|uniref:DUF1869 domain-containing protein n=1 Tax=Providencia sp. Je.9.19 TaxID=3142844 RepID=UPI003DA7F72E
MSEKNKGYLLEIINRNNNMKAEKVFLSPKKLYIPEIAVSEILLLIEALEIQGEINNTILVIAMTNRNNGVSVDKNVGSISELSDPLTAAQIIKDLINIIRGYDVDEESNVCGW